ncbi:hypothetical protein K2173_019675 [Erythroxylum novogranatense]|uniref:Gag protein n=1 Tax=Erythroxylum novogranatense TaxID=1862640 RepID=A0AAV8SLX4_9ROSI|nr:hypothetical protein K2173_019675 [Erythroxylum novogranatense]
MNPLTLLLTNNKLENGDKFNEWRRNLDIVLQYERISWVLTENEPTPLSGDATPEQVQQHERWQNADKTTNCYILASVSDMLQKQIACMKTASAMVHHLHEMFGVRTRSARVKAIQTFHNLRQKPGEPVRDYMMKVISAVTEAEMLGADMDADTQMIMIINSLNSSFQQFKLDYELNSKDYTLSELMNTLQNTEEILNIKAHGPEANVASSSAPR